MPESTWCKNFLQRIRFVATVPCTSLRHKSNTFHAILALCTCLCRPNLRKPVSIKRTKYTRKSQVQNLSSTCPPFTRTHTQTTTPLRNRCIQQPPLSKRSFNITHSHHGSANGRPSLEGYLRRCSSPNSNPANWVATTLAFLSSAR